MFQWVVRFKKKVQGQMFGFSVDFTGEMYCQCEPGSSKQGACCLAVFLPYELTA